MNFDSTKNTVQELVQYCQLIESTDPESATQKSGEKATTSGSGPKSVPKSNPPGRQKRKSQNKSDDYCELHNTYGHSTGDCKVVKAQIKKCVQPTHLLVNGNVMRRQKKSAIRNVKNYIL